MENAYLFQKSNTHSAALYLTGHTPCRNLTKYNKKLLFFIYKQIHSKVILSILNLFLIFENTFFFNSLTYTMYSMYSIVCIVCIVCIVNNSTNRGVIL